MNEVSIYTSSQCAYCRFAKRLLEQRGVVARELNIDADEVNREEMVRRTGRRTVPQVFIGARHIGGYDELAQLERSGQLDTLL
jgi:glutaredoxin 3